MADLTAPLDAEKPELFIPHGPKEPIDRSGGLFEGVLNAVDTGVKMFGMSNKDAGVNEAAVQTSQAMGAANNVLPLPPEVSASVGTLNKVGKAQDQGSMPPGTVDMHLQNIQSSLFAKYPNQAGQIAEYFHRNGYDSLMYQNLYAQQKQTEAMNAAKTDEMTENYKAGFLTALPGMSDNDIMAHGAQVRLAQANLKAAQDQAEANAKNASANKDNYTVNKATDDNKVSSALLDQFATHTDPLLGAWHNEVSANPDLVAKHPEMMTQGINFLEATRMQLHAAGSNLDPTVMKTIDERIDQTEKGFKDFYTDYSKEKQMTLDNMQKTLGISGINAFPVYTQLKGVLGENYLNQVFGGMGPTLPKEMIDGMRQEISGYTNISSGNGLLAVNTVGAMLKGQLKLQDVPQDQLKNVVAGAIVGVSAHTADINTGNLKDPNTPIQFINSASTLIDAAYSIQPQGNPDIGTITTASRSLSDPRVVAAARTLAGNPATADRGQALLLGLRGANQHLLLAAKNANVGTSVSFGGSSPAAFGSAGNEFSVGAPSQAPYKASLDWDAKAGYWKVNSSGAVPDYQIGPLQSRAKVMNDALNVLVNTTGDDKNFPQGATPISLRQYYSGNTGLNELTNAKGGLVKTPQEAKDISAEDTINKTTDAFRKATTDTLKGVQDNVSTIKETTKPLTEAYDPKSLKSQATENIIVTAAPKYAETAKMDPKDFTDLAKAVAVAESGMGTNLKSETDVHGPMQVTQKTGSSYIPSFNRDDPEQDIEAGTHYLADLIAKAGGNLTRALHEYNGGGDPNYAAKVLNYYYQFKSQG